MRPIAIYVPGQDDLDLMQLPRRSSTSRSLGLGGSASTRGRASGVSLGALRDWLGEVGGVHLYHRGLRVFPYGDPGQDWLDMNLRRAASPEERPSTNTSIGRVVVLDARMRS